ncbi:MAG: FecR family protein [Candidatus Rokuibacteriota bacterium]
MRLANRRTAGLLLTTAVVLTSTTSALAQQQAGVVTSLEGLATVSRVALPEPRPLQFKDTVYVHDRIATGERSVVRVLLGGKATVTARERSVLTITEVPGVSSINLAEGRISVAVSKSLMKPGEVIEIKTPNAVSAIRGTVVVAEVLPGGPVRSTISVLRGLIDVTRLETGRRIGRAVNVGALQAITVAGSGPLTQPNAISAYDAQRLTSEFRVIPHGLRAASAAPAAEIAMRHAKDDAERIASARHGAGKATRPAQGLRDSGRASRSEELDDRNDQSDSGKGKRHENDPANTPYFGSDMTPVSATARTPGGSTLSGVGDLLDSGTIVGGSKRGLKK